MKFYRALYYFILAIILNGLNSAFSIAADVKEQLLNSEELEEPKSPAVWSAHVVRHKKREEGIPFLEINNLEVPVTLVPRGGALEPMVVLEGALEKMGWILSVESKNLTLVAKNGSRYFELPLYLKSRVNELTLIAKHVSSGQVLRETIYIYAPQSQEYLKVSPWNAVTVSLGFAGLGYYQSDYGVYKSLVTLMSARYVPLEGETPWSWGAQLNMTLQTLSSEPAKKSPQLIEVKFSGAYRLPSNYNVRLNEQILFGVNYLTMLSNGSPFGFSNLLAPELGWRLRWKKEKNDFIVGDFRFLFLSNQILRHRGFELGASWSRTLSNMHNLEFGSSYSGLVYQSSSNVEVRADLIKFSIGYSL